MASSPSGDEIRALDHRSLDVTDEAAVIREATIYQPDIIINASAYTAVDKAESEPELAFAVNKHGVRHLAKAAASVGAALIHISTDYVFSGDKRACYVESDPTGPAGVYGASKLAGEEEVRQHCKRHIILRTAWVFGEYGNNFVKTMIKLAGERDRLTIVGDQYGGPTSAADIAAAIYIIVKKIAEKSHTAWGIYHYSGFPYVSWAEFAEALLMQAEASEVIARKPEISAIASSEWPTAAHRPANSRLDCSLIRQTFGIEPSDWQAALASIDKYR